MKNTILIFLIIITGQLSAQNQRFYYQLRYIPDSTNREDVKTEMMILDVTKDGSTYYSRDKFVADSTAKADFMKQIQSGSGSVNIQRRDRPHTVNYKVTKTYPDYKVSLYQNINMDNYKISEDQKPVWSIASDKEKIGEFNTQKATTTFGGRSWIAYFTTDIPIQDGPYKFYGLPGLIVKIEDTTGSFIMTLAGIKNEISSTDTTLNLPGNRRVIGFGNKEIEVTKSQFKKVWKDYINDPSKNMREIMMKNGDGTKTMFKLKDENGKEISDPNEIFRAMEKRVKDQLSKNNNLIEPDIYK